MAAITLAKVTLAANAAAVTPVKASAAPNPAAILTVNVTNPKRPGTKCYYGFTLYVSGGTVAANLASYLAGGYPAKYFYSAIRWDLARGYITLA